MLIFLTDAGNNSMVSFPVDLLAFPSHFTRPTAQLKLLWFAITSNMSQKAE